MAKQTFGWQKPLDLEFLEKKPRVRGERVFAVVAFGDTTKFKRWTNHPFSSAEKHTKFMVRLYEEFIRFRNGSGYFVKLLGDGLMAVRELPDNGDRSPIVLQMLTHASGLVKSVNTLIKNLNYPRPDSFRIRVVAGDVSKLIATHSYDKRKQQIDYSDYPVSLAHSLLQVRKEIPCVCHESARELVIKRHPEKLSIKFKRVKVPSFCPEGIEPEDLKVLWSFGCREMLRPPR